MGGDEDKQEILRALTSASGFFRSELAKNLKLRRTPELVFQWDDSIEKGNRILKLMEEVVPEEDR
jgi:ribosome-binding factor A